MVKKLKLMKKLFPVKNPAKITVRGDFDDDLEESFHKQLRVCFAKEEPDGIILLIDSDGGSARVLWAIINTLQRLDLPCMAVAENEAHSCAAQLFLWCQYRVAAPFANFIFHHANYPVKGVDIINNDILSVIVENHRAHENALIKQFMQATGQSLRYTRAVYSSDTPMIATRALELGIVHEITEGSFAIDDDSLEHIFVPETSAK